MVAKPSQSRTRIIVIGILVLLVLGGSAAYYQLSSRKDTARTRSPNTINYDPPTESEKKETEAFKENQQKPETPVPTPPPTSDGKKAVTPTVAYAGQYDTLVEVSAFVPGIIEDGGTCTLTVAKGQTAVTKTSASVKDATTTRCGLFSFAAKELSAGTWNATVAYSSATSTGSSQPRSFEVK